ncbi:CDP-glucose 4,6-dehydratase [Cognatishimia sp. MH4019]|uniref:CDP-glucose 4,6-dehydratase n=1 Tax=Cognatishimia sp. MH4019 TaxID=2854030 RepID=UPI001CD414AF
MSLPNPSFAAAFKGRRVLLTGHTGFKGGWLALWLRQLGAQVTGIALPAEPGDSFFDSCGVGERIDSRIADIRDPKALFEAGEGADAEVLIHMAAQPLVRLSYAEPVETFATNVMGTAHVLELAKTMPNLRAIIVVTSDKCYDNREWEWGYRENDALGGADPYSASKGCAEILAQSYRRSFFQDPDGPCLATVRAGNVFGGGDWGAERLVPDIIRAATGAAPLSIRNPLSVRPWQHVLEPLAGYLTLAAHLLEQGHAYEGAWNFGPDAAATVPVRDLAQAFEKAWGHSFDITYGDAPDGLHEAGLLRLDSTKAQTQLGWRPRLGLSDAVHLTAEWYRAHEVGHQMAHFTMAQIDAYTARMSPETSQNVTPPRRASDVPDVPKASKTLMTNLN